MAGNQSDALPEPLREWVDERAAASDDDFADIVSRAVSLYRLVEENAGGDGDGLSNLDGFDDRLDEQIDGLDDRLSALDRRITTVEDDIDAKVMDVRDRVVQIKRELDDKAAVDHDHPTLDERTRAAEAATGRIEDRTDELASSVERGFENYEEVLTHLTDETEGLDDKLTRLARAVVDLRRRTTTVEQQLTRGDVLNALKERANRQNEPRARCDDCANPVTISLLTEPNCPHCDAGFVDVEPSGRFFGSATLTTGRPSALMPGDDPSEDDDIDTTTVTTLLGESKNA